MSYFLNYTLFIYVVKWGSHVEFGGLLSGADLLLPYGPKLEPETIRLTDRYLY